MCVCVFVFDVTLSLTQGRKKINCSFPDKTKRPLSNWAGGGGGGSIVVQEVVEVELHFSKISRKQLISFVEINESAQT